MKSAVIIYNKKKEAAVEFFKRSKKYLENKGVRMLGIENINSADFVVVIGGDGTLLGASKHLIGSIIPVVAINLGSLGFLTEIKKEEAFETFDRIMNGNFKCEERMFMKVKIENDTFYCLNDVVLSKGGVNARMATINLYANDIYVSTYRADGIILATPTGSTAYSLSAGGPILMPGLNAMAITPIAPHTLSARPIIMDGGKVISFESINKDRELQLMLDGQRNFALKNIESVKVTMSNLGFYLVKPDKRDYYSVLREKLKWGDKLC
jgi:NAD+ kinase